MVLGHSSRKVTRTPSLPCPVLRGSAKDAILPAHPPGSHLPDTGVLYTLAGSDRRNLLLDPHRYPHSGMGSGSRGRGLQEHRRPLLPCFSPGPLCCTEASCFLYSARLPPLPAQFFPCAQERTPGCCHLTYLTVPPREAWRAITLVFANVVKASATIVTGTRGTGVWLSWGQKIPITVKC